MSTVGSHVNCWGDVAVARRRFWLRLADPDGDVTMDVYTQAVTMVKRTAHSRVARQIMGADKRGEKG